MDILADLNEPQRAAVTHIDGPLLVLAGAGSGKTRVITRRVAWMVHQGVRPWNVLAITFTNKAAQEMRQRVEQLGTARGATISTFHALCARLLREFAEEAGLRTNFSIYDRDDQLKMVKEAVAALDLSTENFPPARIHAAISAAKNELKSPQDIAASAGNFHERNVAGIYGKYDELLQASNALDFDDLLLRAACMLRDRKDVLERLSDRYRYVMIDEYQDTNHVQYVIAHGIAMAHENICATGDPDQSIYAWRGADINNILEFEQDYPGAKVIRLEENYRSTAPILAAASQLIAHNKLRKDKSLWTRREGGLSVRVVTCDDEHAESRLVARRIAAFHASGGRWDDVAVFYRVNSLSRVMEEALMRAGVPYRIARGTEFYNRKEIKDVLAYLRVLVNPRDDLSMRRIINVPARGIGDTTIGRLEQYAGANRVGLLEACRRAAQAGLSSGTAAKVIGFAAMIDSLTADLRRPCKSVLEDVISRSGLGKSLAGAGEDQKQVRANVDELISAAAEFDANRDFDDQSDSLPLEEYLHQISLVSDVDHFEGGSGAVTLMTLHAAKGLEFPAVFIIGCEAGLLPFQRMDEADNAWNRAAANDRLEEERRLAFVGMTRAREQLVLTCARQRKFRGKDSPQAASQFLYEIGGESVTLEDATTSPDDRIATRSGYRGGFYADVAQREQIEAMEGAMPGASALDGTSLDETAPLPDQYEHLRIGSRVHSPTFGGGKVIAISQPWPHTRVRVDFPEYGAKTLVLAMAKLELL